MPGNQKLMSDKRFLSIIEGTWRQKVDNNTEGAIYRAYESSTGNQGSKWELIYINWTGTVRGIEVKEGEYGEQCFIQLDDAVLVFNTQSRYFSDCASKLMSADITKPITFHPYSMEIDGKKKTGVSVQQNGVRLSNYYYDFDKKKSLHGFPVPDETKKDKKTYWKLFFLEVSDFLIKELNSLEFDVKKEESQTPPPVVEQELDDLPF